MLPSRATTNAQACFRKRYGDAIWLSILAVRTGCRVCYRDGHGSSRVADTIRQVDVSDVTYYRWRQEFGTLKAYQIKHLKELESENACLHRAVCELTLDKFILQKATQKLLSPASCRPICGTPTRGTGNLRAPYLLGTG